MKNPYKMYIGDSVFAEARPAFPFGAELVLTTENGGPPSNTIVLGPLEWDALLGFVKSLEKKEPADDPLP